MKLDQSVFEGAPDYITCATTDFDGETWLHEIEPNGFNDHIWIVQHGSRIKFAGMFDATDWQNSMIRRDHCSSCPNKTDGVCCGSAK